MSSATMKLSTSAPILGASRQADRIDTLSFPRFFVALLIVFKHFYRGPLHRHGQWADLGVNFFFVLHGYVVTVSKLTRKWPPEGEVQMLPNPRTLFRRFAANYPVYFLGIVLCVLIDIFGMNRPLRGTQLLAELTMTSSFFSSYLRPETCWWYNTPLWFVGVLAWFWLAEQASFSMVSRLWRTGYPVIAMSALFISWNMIFEAPPLNGIPTQLGDATPFRPFHQYWAGIMLAFIARDRAARGVERTTWMATAAFLVFVGICSIDPGEEIAAGSFKFIVMAGWATPLQCMLILGLSEGADPLGRLCVFPGSGYIGDISYAFYAMQTPVFWLVTDGGWQHHWSGNLQFLVSLPVLLIVATLIYHFYQLPIQQALDGWGKALPT